MRAIQFVLSARKHGHAYIDMDGCLLHKMPIPAHVPPEQALDYWMANLCKTDVVLHRLALVYLLKALGVQVHLWTNRSPEHESVTRASLGRHYALFSSYHYGAGSKRQVTRLGPCMDDEERNIGTVFKDWRCAPTRCKRDLMSVWQPNDKQEQV